MKKGIFLIVLLGFASISSANPSVTSCGKMGTGDLPLIQNCTATHNPAAEGQSCENFDGSHWSLVLGCADGKEESLARQDAQPTDAKFVNSCSDFGGSQWSLVLGCTEEKETGIKSTQGAVTSTVLNSCTEFPSSGWTLVWGCWNSH